MCVMVQLFLEICKVIEFFFNHFPGSQALPAVDFFFFFFSSNTS